ncbi:hypothetical protein GCM10011575_41930 [Microlunatus endophyticus]|uniref:ER-bound oxygenase mpaB/mpaB'/Rubber oxygenase catalytic domain-containing protein n=1 Tax=Microlunatus endophyticus TaxID=1716077 RepID=A0A917W919_9ACTN|nr:oxygenase MpaB family protein [Microlunatus endophyticus]GGL79157.1 hypothetical protein GCM10011575_41930 [Microlunatus endophyticus]
MHRHEERRRRTAALAELDPEQDWHEIYKRLTLSELPAEARFGFQLAFYRPLAVPRMAKLLQSTGHMQFDTTRRAYDTGLIMHEIIYGGVDSDRARRMVKLLNRLHDRSDIHAEDMTYLLAALMVVPTRFMDRYGWRTVTNAERRATWRFWDAVGDRMTISDRPASYDDAEVRLDRYEETEFAASEAGALLTNAAINALRDRLPRPVRPFGPQLTSTLVGDPRVSRALSLPAPNPFFTGLAAGVAGVRRQLQRRRAPSTKVWFTPGQPAGEIYPHGYELDQLGPQEH